MLFGFHECTGWVQRVSTERWTVGVHHAFLHDSDILPVLKMFARAGFILGWLPQCPIVMGTRKSKALWQKQKEEEKSVLQCELHLLHFQARVVKNIHVLAGMVPHFKCSRMLSYHDGLVLYKDTLSVRRINSLYFKVFNVSFSLICLPLFWLCLLVIMVHDVLVLFIPLCSQVLWVAG